MSQHLETHLHDVKIQRAELQEIVEDFDNGKALPFHRLDGTSNIAELLEERNEAASYVTHIDQLIAEMTESLKRL